MCQQDSNSVRQVKSQPLTTEPQLLIKHAIVVNLLPFSEKNVFNQRSSIYFFSYAITYVGRTLRGSQARGRCYDCGRPDLRHWQDDLLRAPSSSD